MKKLLLLFVLCAVPTSAFAQWLEKSRLLPDSVTISRPQPVLPRPPQIAIRQQYHPFNYRVLATDSPYVDSQNVMHPHSRIMIIRPLRFIIHQRYVRYCSQIIFLEPPQIIIQPAQIVFK